MEGIAISALNGANGRERGGRSLHRFVGWSVAMAKRSCLNRPQDVTGQDRPEGSDARLVAELARGATVADAARAAGLSEATAYRRLRSTDFKQQIEAARAELLGRMVSGFHATVKCRECEIFIGIGHVERVPLPSPDGTGSLCWSCWHSVRRRSQPSIHRPTGWTIV